MKSEISNLSRISSTVAATSSSVKTVETFPFVKVKCKVAVSTVYFFSLFNEAIPPTELT